MSTRIEPTQTQKISILVFPPEIKDPEHRASFSFFFFWLIADVRKENGEDRKGLPTSMTDKRMIGAI
jgi:hypothetical protein